MSRSMWIQISVCCTVAVAVNCFKYTPQAYSQGSCSDLPVDLHTQVKARIEEIEDTQDIEERLNMLTSSIQALNSSIQQQGTEDVEERFDVLTSSIQALNSSIQQQVSGLANNLQQLKAAVSNLTTSAGSGAENPLGTQANPAPSCKYIPSGFSSGYYWLNNSKTGGSPMQVYCDMERIGCCNISGGWTRVANVDMRDPNQTCPSGFSLINRDTPPLRTCGRLAPPFGIEGFGCRSTLFNIPEVNYTRVCGRVIGYQKGNSVGFTTGFTINGIFVDGAWLTLANNNGDPDLVWTFAIARDEVTSDTRFICPCTRPELIIDSVRDFVGQDYFCDTGSSNAAIASTFYDMDPLWDGQGCGGNSICCEFNNPPWFCKQLPQPTSDNIELRMCNTQAAANGDSPLEIIELYVQ